MGPAPIPLDLHHNSIGCPNLNTNILDQTNEQCGIREVWAVNLEDEFRSICQVCNNRYVWRRKFRRRIVDCFYVE